jgi:hypothetical protein
MIGQFCNLHQFRTLECSSIRGLTVYVMLHVCSHVLFEMDDCSSDCSSLGLLRLCGGVALATKRLAKFLYIHTTPALAGRRRGKFWLKI